MLMNRRCDVAVARARREGRSAGPRMGARSAAIQSRPVSAVRERNVPTRERSVDRDLAVFGLRAGIVIAAGVAAIALAEVELGVACLIALVKLAGDLPAPPRRDRPTAYASRRI